MTLCDGVTNMWEQWKFKYQKTETTIVLKAIWKICPFTSDCKTYFCLCININSEWNMLQQKREHIVSQTPQDTPLKLSQTKTENFLFGSIISSRLAASFNSTLHTV